MDSTSNTPDRVTVEELITAYLDLAIGELSPTVAGFMRYLTGLFVADYGTRLVCQLKPIDLLRWVKARRRWKADETIRRSISAIKAVFNWGVRMVIDRNPFRFVNGPKGQPRRAMADDEFQALLRHAGPEFRRVLVFLKFTGMRPAELSALCWENIDFDRKAIVLAKHKTMKKTHKPRVIILHPVVVKLLRYLQAARVAGRQAARSAGQRPAACRRVHGSHQAPQAPARVDRQCHQGPADQDAAG